MLTIIYAQGITSKTGFHPLRLYRMGEETTEREIFATHFEHQGRLYLEVCRRDGSYAFAHLEGEEIKLNEQVAIGNRIIKPRPLPQIDGQTVEVVELPSENIVCSNLLRADTLYDRKKRHSPDKLRLVHEAKKASGAKVTSCE